MRNWAFYPVFAGAFLSFICWSYLIWHKHDRANPRSLSELAADEHVLGYFRAVLWICDVLFAITLFAYVVPRIDHSLFVATAAFLMIAGEFLLGVFPARGRFDRLHSTLASTMGFAMATLAALFTLNSIGVYSTLEALATVIITVLGVCAFFDRKHFIYYEMPFIFLSHLSILIVALSLPYAG